MSGFGNSYFQVESEFRVLRVDGHSPSNTYIGSSRASDPVLMAENVMPGDEIHDLVGGMFHVSRQTGETRSIRLVPPKHVFEKSYGPSPEASRRDDLVVGGYMSRLVGQTLKGNYRDAIEVSSKNFPELKGGIKVVDRDPLNDIADEVSEALEASGVSMDSQSILFHSHSAYENAKLSFSVDGVPGRFRVYIYETGTLRMIAPDKIEPSSGRVVDADLKLESVEDIATKFSDRIREIENELGLSAPTL